MYFGLGLRQLIFSALALIVAGVSFFFLRPSLGLEVASWVSILAAVPFGALGFITYNGMTAERFIWTWIKSEFILPRRLRFYETNFYYEAVKRGETT